MTAGSPRIRAFLIQVLLVLCVLWLPLTGSFLIDPQVFPDTSQVPGLSRMLVFLSLAVFFALLYFPHKYSEALVGRFTALFVFCLLVFLAQVSIYFTSRSPDAPQWLFLASVVCGCASAGAYMSLVLLLGSFLNDNLFGIIIKAFLLYAVVLAAMGLGALVDLRIPMLIQIASPLAAILCGWLAYRAHQGLPQDTAQSVAAPSPEDAAPKRWRYKTNIIVSFVSVGIVMGAVLQELFSRAPSSLACMAAALGILVATLAIWLTRRLANTPINNYSALRMTAPFLACIVALMPFGIDRYYLVFAVAVMGIWAHGVAHRAATCPETSTQLSLKPAFVMNQTFLLRFVGLAAGSVFFYMMAALGQDFRVLAAVVLAILMAAVMAFQASYRDYVPPWHSYSNDSQSVFLSSCSFVSEKFGLSPRESEVLLLLAKGRNATFIAKEFTISAQTARTHIKHIYVKLGAHSRQELMDIIDQASWFSLRNPTSAQELTSAQNPRVDLPH